MNIRKIAMGAVVATVLVASAPGAMLAAGKGPADGRCVAQGAGFTFDGPTKAAVARGEVVEGVKMNTVILDHAFNNANAVEGLLKITICE